eukprot:scaffold13892_cov75-Isochrysis_galbana.AAC.2
MCGGRGRTHPKAPRTSRPPLGAPTPARHARRPRKWGRPDGCWPTPCLPHPGRRPPSSRAWRAGRSRPVASPPGRWTTRSWATRSGKARLSSTPASRAPPLALAAAASTAEMPGSE